MDLDLDRVAAIVDQEDDHRKLAPDHLRHFLRRELEGAVADHRDDPSFGRAHRIAECRRHGPADRAPLHLDLETRAAREFQAHAVEPGVAGFGDDRGVGGEQ